jgi:8-oxo-dGTP pyrophosphatase MutT (NUDIX family)
MESKSPRIRPIAVCYCESEGKVLLEEGYDAVKDQRFFRAIGGGIEFGETAEAAVRREWMEELGAELGEVRLLQVVENIFEYEGRPGHEIVFMLEGAPRDTGRFQAQRMEITESTGLVHRLSWVPIEDMANGRVTVYPRALCEYAKSRRS